MKRCLVSAPLVACALAVVGASQQPEQQRPVFRGTRDAVRVFATVTDRDGRLVATLEQENFEVRDEGTPQPILQFDKTPQAIRLIVMLGVSGSMEGNAPLLRAAGVQLFGRLLKDDVARVGSFGNEVTISPSSTSDRRELNAALPTTIVPGSPTPLWRAIDQAMGAFGEDDGRRKVILVLSDGKDSGPTSLRERPSSQADVIDHTPTPIKSQPRSARTAASTALVSANPLCSLAAFGSRTRIAQMKLASIAMEKTISAVIARPVS